MDLLPWVQAVFEKFYHCVYHCVRHVLEGTKMDALVIAEFAVAHVTVILDDFVGGKSCKRNEYFKP